jgi:predicted TPR repeat methyltransferase
MKFSACVLLCAHSMTLSFFQEKLMALNAHSSGDLIADRRGDYARMLAASGDYLAAVDLIEQALEIAPQWAGGWFKLGEYAERGGCKEKAIIAYQHVRGLDKSGIFGVDLKLAVLGILQAPEQMPSIYVAGLFDDYADRFETSLVGKLNYSVPEKLTAIILENSGPDHHFKHAVDLGCGTGLFGLAFQHHAAAIEGFDISINMLAKAHDKGIYSHLAIADLTKEEGDCGLFAEGLEKDRADLVASADVMMYLGQLDNVFSLSSTLLNAGGYLAFSVEDAQLVEGYVLQPTLRYAHSEAYVQSLLTQYGFDLVDLRKTTIRTDGGKPIYGILFLARKLN